MKRIVICLFAVYCLLGFSLTVSAAEDGKEVKAGTVKGYKESKDAIVRDAKAMKEDIPKGLKEAKESAIQQSKDVKEGAAKEFKEIRDNMAHPKLTPKSDQK
jgi:hypothetical protein